MKPDTITLTSAPRTAVYKIPDVRLQPTKIKTDTFQKTWSGRSPQMRAEAGKTIPRIDPVRSQTKTNTWGRIQGVSPNPSFTNADTNRSIKAVTSSQTEADALKKTEGVKLNPATTNTDTFRNISGIRPDRVKPDETNISSTFTSTSTAAQPSGRPAAGEKNSIFKSNATSKYTCNTSSED